MPLVESRYAEALLGIYEEQEDEKLDTFQKDFKFFVDSFNNETGFKTLLLSPKVEMINKKNLIREVYKGNIDDNVVNLIFLLLEKGRIGCVSEIYDECSKLIDIKKSVLNIKIISPFELSKEQIQKIKEKKLERYKARDAKIEIVIDKELIGGIKVEIGDTVTSASAKDKLEELRQILISL